MASQNLNSVLTAFPALTSPITTAQAKTLMSNVQQLQNIDNRQTLAISVLSLIYLLNHAGGTNYKTNIPQLVTDASAFMGAFEPMMLVGQPGDMTDQFEAVINWNTAYSVDTTLSANINTLLTTVGILQSYPDASLHQFIVYLEYACSIKSV